MDTLNIDNLPIGKKVAVKDFCKKCNLKIAYNQKQELEIHSVVVNRPGLMLAGYKNNFAQRRVQIMGQTEIGFLQENDTYVEMFFQKDFPCVIISRGLKPTESLLRSAKHHNHTILLSDEDTIEVMEKVSAYLTDLVALTKSMHGVLLDIFGTGVLLLGKSSIGKSEAALELIYRGHRLISDDAVILKRVDDSIYGTSPSIIKHFMEIRGVGIIDIKAIYGEGSIIDRKRVELIIELEHWEMDKEYERVGKEHMSELIFGVQIPKLLIPVNAGRNVATVIEVAVRDFRLKQGGHIPYAIVQKRMEEE